MDYFDDLLLKRLRFKCLFIIKLIDEIEFTHSNRFATYSIRILLIYFYCWQILTHKKNSSYDFIHGIILKLVESDWILSNHMVVVLCVQKRQTPDSPQIFIIDHAVRCCIVCYSICMLPYNSNLTFCLTQFSSLNFTKLLLYNFNNFHQNYYDFNTKFNSNWY